MSSLHSIAEGFTLAYIYVAIPLFGSLLIGCTFGFYWTCHKLKDKNFNLTSTYRALMARRPILIYLYIISLLFLILIERPISIYCSISTECIIYSYYISPLLFALSTYSMFYLLLLRTWLLYYEENFSLAKKDIIWQKNLYLNYCSASSSFNKYKQSWWIDNRLTYGNMKWLIYTRLSAPYSISVLTTFIIGTILRGNDLIYYYIINGILISIPVILMFIIWKKMNPIHDFYRIRAELRYTMYIWLSLAIIFGISGISFQFGNKSHPEYIYIGYSLSLWYIGIFLTLNGLLSTAWIIYLTNRKHFEYSQQFITFEMEKLQRTYQDQTVMKRITNKLVSLNSQNNMNNMNNVNAIESKSDVISSINKAEEIYQSFPLRDILLHEEGFRYFMQHMTDEFSVENLLFLVDVVRYKYAKNGFKHIEMYSTAADQQSTTASASDTIDDDLGWYLPLPDSLVCDVVKPASAQVELNSIKSISVNINEDLNTLPHANINAHAANDVDNDNKMHLRVIKRKKKNGRTKSSENTTFNPLFNNNNNNVVVGLDGENTHDDYKSWEDAQIAWGSLSHAIMIYEKYIKRGSLFEINISHKFRTDLKKQFIIYKELFIENSDNLIDKKLKEIMNYAHEFNDNIQIFAKYPEKRKELEIIFDQTCKQIESLMNDSYLRFRQTQIYHRLLKQLVKDQLKIKKNKLNNK